MTRCECDDREKGTGLCTRGPERPDTRFGRSVISYTCVCVWMLSYRCFQEGRKTHLCLFFFFLHSCPQVDEWSILAQVKLSLCPHSLHQSLLWPSDNGTVLQRGHSLYPILLWPPPAFVRIHHDNSPDPNLHYQPSASTPSLSGERLNIKFRSK